VSALPGHHPSDSDPLNLSEPGAQTDEHPPPCAGLAVAILTTALWSLPASAAFTLKDGEFVYEQTGEARDSNLSAGFGSGPDNLFQDFWLYRLASATAATPFPDNTTPTSSTPSTAVLDFDPAAGFRAELAFALLDLGGGVGAVRQDMTIVNQGLAELVIDLFYYIDLDVAGSFDGDTATLAGPNRVLFEDGAARFTAIGVGADAFQVTEWSDLLDALIDGSITNLDNTGVPFGPGDATAGFQWSLTIPVDGTATVTGAIGIGDFEEADLVPVPSTLALLALGGLALGWRRAARCA
jgi:hypothetical protein